MPAITSMPWVTIVTVLALVQFIAFGSLVSLARGKYQVPAPAIIGNEVFERYFRVHMNTLELLVVFVPALWLFALQVSANGAAGLGTVYLIGRLIYLRSYIRNPASRALGFGLSSLPILIMLAWVLFVAIRQLLV
ncbi:MAG: MAPEG family protein [Pseudomonadota bacterium]